MSRRKAMLWSMILGGWWLGTIFGRMSQEMDLGWWDTLFLFAVGAFTVWVLMAVQRNHIDREDAPR